MTTHKIIMDLKENKIRFAGFLLVICLLPLELYALYLGNEIDIVSKRGISELFPFIFISIQVYVITNYYVKFNNYIKMIGEIIDSQFILSNDERKLIFIDTIKSKIFNKTYYILIGVIFGLVYLGFSINKYFSWHNNPQSIEVISHLYYTSLPMIYFSLLLWFVIYFIIGINIYIIFMSIYELSKIGRYIKIKKDMINLYAIDRCGGFSKFSDLFISLFICCNSLIILGMTVILKFTFRWFDILLIGIAIMIVISSFFISQYGFHETLIRRKEDELKKLSDDLENAINTNNIESILIINKINEIEKMRDWIINTKSIYDLSINCLASMIFSIFGIFS